MVSGLNLKPKGSRFKSPQQQKDFFRHCSRTVAHLTAVDPRWPCDISGKIGDLSPKLSIYREILSIFGDFSWNFAGPIFLHEISYRYPPIHDISPTYRDIFLLELKWRWKWKWKWNQEWFQRNWNPMISIHF